MDAGVPAHYGNPLAEQRPLASGDRIVDLSHRAVLSISGDDRLSWIDSLTSQSVKRLAPGESSETLLLDPTGHVEYAVRLLDDGTELWLLIEAAEAPGLLDWLTKMRFMLRVDPRDRTSEFATVGTFGSADLAAAAPNGVPLVWHDPWSSVAVGGHQYATAADHDYSEWTYSEILVDRASLGSIELPAAGLLALEALRIAAWRPRFATEADEKSIPHELDWLRSAVHLSKGCYRGQETVAKVHNLGHPPRRLVMLHLDGSDAVLPSPGDEVVLGENVVGRVTSVGLHYELGPIALAVIKRSADPTAELAVRSQGILVPAAQEIVVPPSAGAEADVPRLPRLGAVQR
ncbi:CAF17-like 4Fe-4S cluster assembly/insertion protein YgfZ [Lacisediminihabitans changchengi]|uniref:Folate-binding protein YgfZ n=1 Tax=Lacisediminihabitans changchengi TaxID=2787634 RepID=A0A934W4G3_9MICO|nr:folate-binding protein YgfZ [Lacisediminihabitans changchengi]MBK4348244.1 folate-binding protein YgfZ [Lacisediminihabitans changchengi]